MTTLIRYYLFICVYNYHKARHIKDTLLCEENKREVYRSVQHPFLGFPSLRHLTFGLHESHVSDSLSDLDKIFPRTKYHLGIFGLVLGVLALHWVTDKSFPEILHLTDFQGHFFISPSLPSYSFLLHFPSSFSLPTRHNCEYSFLKYFWLISPTFHTCLRTEATTKLRGK